MKNVAATPDRREGAGSRSSGGGAQGLSLGPAGEGGLLLCRGYCLWLHEAGDPGFPRGPLPAGPGAPGSPPLFPSGLLCTIIRPRQKEPEMGPRCGEDSRANRKEASASWTIYGGCLKHGGFCDARYSGYSSEESILCPRDVLCLFEALPFRQIADVTQMSAGASLTLELREPWLPKSTAASCRLLNTPRFTLTLDPTLCVSHVLCPDGGSDTDSSWVPHWNPLTQKHRNPTRLEAEVGTRLGSSIMYFPAHNIKTFLHKVSLGGDEDALEVEGGDGCTPLCMC